MSPHENSAGEERADEWGRMQGSTSWSGMESGRQGRYATRRDWIITNWDERAGTRSEGGEGVEDRNFRKNERIEFSEKMENLKSNPK